MSIEVLEIHTPAKINLCLEIIGKRPDGYHDLRTVMQKVKLFDRIVLKKISTGICLTCPGSDLPEDNSNLAFKAASAFFNQTGVKSGVSIKLHKNIPVAAGLGGGSSDAAAVLTGLDELFGTEMEQEAMLKLAGSLGADVPFFIVKHPAVLATGIGDKFEIVSPINNCQIVLVNPGLHVSTKWVYDNFALTSEGNTYMLSGYLKSKVNHSSKGLYLPFKNITVPAFLNDLEAVTIKKYNQLHDIKVQMLQQGAIETMMSGSGPTVFGLFSKQQLAKNCCSFFKNTYEDVFLVDPLIN